MRPHFSLPSALLLIVFYGITTAVWATTLSTPPVSSLSSICAASTCLFRNGSVCNRTLDTCPRCVQFDPLLNASICSNLQGHGTVCLTNFTLCPETPLEPATGATAGGEGYDDDDDEAQGYTWVEVGSASNGSSTTSTSGSTEVVVIPDTTTDLPSLPPAERSRRPKPVVANDAGPSPSEASARTTAATASPMLPPWLIITFSVVVAVAATLIVAVLIVQSRQKRSYVEQHNPDDAMQCTPSSETDDTPYDGGKDQFSPNSYGYGYEPASLLSNEPTPHAVADSSLSSRSASSPSSSRNDTGESGVPSTFAWRMDEPVDPNSPVMAQSFPAQRATSTHHQRRAVQSLPPLQPRTRAPGWSTSPLPAHASRPQLSQSSFPRFTGGARVSLPPPVAVDRSWTTNEFELMDDASSNASDAYDDDDVFLTDKSGASAVAECDYVDAPTPSAVPGSHHAETLASTENAMVSAASDADVDVDIYPDTSVTTRSDAGRMFSPLSMRTRDTAALQDDVVEDWASHRTTAPADSDFRTQQQKLAQWKSKFYMEL